MFCMTNKSLTSRVISGSMWILALRVARRSVGVVSAIVLARILSPEDYGAVAVGLLCVSLVQVLTEVGVKQNLIQERNHTQGLIWTAWTVDLIRSLLITGLVFLLAPFAAAFFKQPQATAIIRGLSLVPLLRSIQNIKVIYFQRELQFKKVFLYELSGAVGGLATAITAALVLRNAWALVLGQMAAAAIPTAVSYVLFPELPRLRLDKSSLGQLYKFGRWMFLASLVSYFALQGDKFFVGRLFDPSVLGMYTMAAMITNIIIQEFGKGISYVLFPAYAKIKGDLKRLKEAFVKSYELLLGLLVPSCLGLYLVSDDFVSVVLGDKWLEMIPILKLLAMAAMVRGLFVSGSGLVLALGRPKYAFITGTVRASTLLVLLLTLPSIYGVNGVIFSLLLANSIAFPIHMLLWRFLLPVKMIDFARIYSVLIALLAAIFASVSFTTAVLNAGVIRLLISVIAGLSSYFMCALLIYKYLDIGPAHLWCCILLGQKANAKRVEQPSYVVKTKVL